MMSRDVDTIRDVFRRLDESDGLPDTAALSGILEAAREALADESPAVRPRDADGLPGGLVLLESGISTVIVPDLHARTGYMRTLIDFPMNGSTLLGELASGRVQVVCVGDGFHSEARGAERWRRAWDEYRGGFRKHRAMDEEMRESLVLMAMVMILKSSFPVNFHFLKGNHENVANTEGGGNRPFGKYAWEGQMVRDWFITFLGEDMLDDWADFEDSLPLLAVGDRFLVSHAEPRKVWARDRVIGCRGDDEVIFDFTWTGNGEAREGSVEEMLRIYLGPDAEGALYFGGHRPVRELFGLRAGGRYVQIHNPDRYIAAVLEGGRNPDPERDIRVLDAPAEGEDR